MSSRFGDKKPEPVTRTANNGTAKAAIGGREK
jgi:hypothetical protein